MEYTIFKADTYDGPSGSGKAGLGNCCVMTFDLILIGLILVTLILDRAKHITHVWSN